MRGRRGEFENRAVHLFGERAARIAWAQDFLGKKKNTQKVIFAYLFSPEQLSPPLPFFSNAPALRLTALASC